ncbi:MAG: hypothetical protein ACK5N0_02440 [Synechococcaceae cyanobacterium]
MPPPFRRAGAGPGASRRGRGFPRAEVTAAGWDLASLAPLRRWRSSHGAQARGSLRAPALGC